jgi:hypothetical protein
MKLSEAMMLGYTMVKFDPRVYLIEGCGCLSGAALAATGKEFGMPDHILAEWPWLDVEFDHPLAAGMRSKALHIIDALAFAVERGEWTIEQAADWIRQNEPAEPESVPKPVQILSEVAQ